MNLKTFYNQGLFGDVLDLSSYYFSGIETEPTVTVALSPFDQAVIATVDSQLDIFGESVSYYPADGSPVRAIVAIVERYDNQAMAGVPNGIRAGHFQITVANDSTKGISSAELDCGGDRIETAQRIGGEIKKRRSGRVLSMDAGFMDLEVQG